MEWQAIETAPDDHEILLAAGRLVASGKRIGGGSGDWYFSAGGHLIWEGGDERGGLVNLDFEPTHWMPLPDPPIFASNEKERGTNEPR